MKSTGFWVGVAQCTAFTAHNMLGGAEGGWNFVKSHSQTFWFSVSEMDLRKYFPYKFQINAKIK